MVDVIFRTLEATLSDGQWRISLPSANSEAKDYPGEPGSMIIIRRSENHFEYLSSGSHFKIGWWLGDGVEPDIEMLAVYLEEAYDHFLDLGFRTVRPACWKPACLASMTLEPPAGCRGP